MKRKFDYSQKENYTQAELDAILGQHESFLNVAGISAELETARGELKPFKTKARNEKLVSLLPKGANAKYSKDIIKLTDITEDMSDEDVTKAFNATLEEREYLREPVVNDEAGIKKESFKKTAAKIEVSDEQVAKDARFANV